MTNMNVVYPYLAILAGFGFRWITGCGRFRPRFVLVPEWSQMTDAEQNGFGLQCQEVSHWFGETKVLYDLNLKVDAGQFVSLIGPSGCGKSTLCGRSSARIRPTRGRF